MHLKLVNNLAHRLKNVCFLRSFSASNPRWKVLFFGTDEFSVFSLRKLLKDYRNGGCLSILEVCTTKKKKKNPVCLLAEEENLNLHEWPISSTPIKFDLGVVVSFGHLIPENVINKFPLGIINVHASLLPRWRGAAPIIYALANGDTETGVTIMRIKPKKFDIGEIIAQCKIPILSDIKMPELHKRLGNLGADLLLETIEGLPKSLELAQPQPEIGVTFAPKIDPSFAKVNWTKMSSLNIHNLERALTGIYPITTTYKGLPVKLFNVSMVEKPINPLAKPGLIEFNKEKNCLLIHCVDGGCVSVEKIGILGKKVMSAKDFNNGYLVHDREDNKFFE